MAQDNRTKLLVIIGIAGVLAGVGIVSLALNILERKQEARVPFAQVVELTDDTEDPAIWGKNFPLQYDMYLKTTDQQRTRYGGSEAVPHTPTDVDPRSVVAQSRLEEDPRLKIMWAGYAFSKDFREERGHAYMLEDQIFTERQKAVKQPGACLNCHASLYVPFKKAGGGDIVKGFHEMNKKPYFEAKGDIKHPVTCIDCHDSKTLELRITRPAFMEGIKQFKASQGIKDYDVTKMATRQEMRTFVCAQCHVEYYFKGEGKTLTFPWHKGLKPENMLAYYDEVGFRDWTHAETGAPVLKAQHPEFELYSQGIHARSGVACADCHMPYTRVGGQKISDHHVRSPVLNLNRACQTCHNWPEEELKARIETIQERTYSMRNTALDSLMDLVKDIKKARSQVNDPKVLEEAQKYQRHAQFLVDFIEAENSMGFHAPQEAVRVLGQSIEATRKGQKALMVALAKAQGQPLPVEAPPAAPGPALSVYPTPPPPAAAPAAAPGVADPAKK